MSDSHALLEARGLHGGHRGVEVLHGVDISVAASEVVALLGPNGAGKTTLLLMLAGLLEPRGGEIRWRGREGGRAPHRLARQGLAFVGERAVFHELTVGENLRLGRGGVEPAVEIFPELGPLLARRAGLLSGGEQRMVAVGRALAAGARALIVDELSLGLAPAVVTRLLEAIRRAARSGVGVLLVEQQLGRVLSVADHGHVMNRGEITFSGTRDELRAGADVIREAYLAQRPPGETPGAAPEGAA